MSFVCSKLEETLLEQAQLHQTKESSIATAAIHPYQFRMSEIEGFRYRSKVVIIELAALPEMFILSSHCE